MTFRQDRAGRRGSPWLRIAGFAALAAASIALLSAPVAAQRARSNVIIDYSVLDELGPAPNVPQLLMPRGGGFATPPPGAVTSPVLRGPQGATGGDVQLTPPRSTAKRPAKKSSTKTQARAKTASKAKASAPATRSAARSQRPAAPPQPAAAPPPPPPPVAEPPPPPAATTGSAGPGRVAVPEPLTPPSEATAPARPTAPPSPPSPPPVVAVPVTPALPTAPTPSPSRSAALSPPGEAAANTTRIPFETGSARIGPEATGTLKRVAQNMAADDKLRVQLLAYAGGTEETASQARRLSLSRALAARSYLIGEGVRSTRIDVRALGNKSEGGPPDRIDVVVTRR